MTTWSIVCGNILELPADGLLCSANPSLNLSGGVGGAFLLRFGSEMQTYLHNHLKRQKLPVVPVESVIVAPPCGSPYRAVAHAVAIDPFYDTNAERIISTYRVALDSLSDNGCRSIASACLGCGYGRCSPMEFASAIRRLIQLPFLVLDQVTLATTNPDLVELLSEVVGKTKKPLWQTAPA